MCTFTFVFPASPEKYNANGEDQTDHHKNSNNSTNNYWRIVIWMNKKHFRHLIVPLVTTEVKMEMKNENHIIENG